MKLFLLFFVLLFDLSCEDVGRGVRKKRRLYFLKLVQVGVLCESSTIYLISNLFFKFSSQLCCVLMADDVEEKWKVDSNCLQWQQFQNYFELTEDKKRIHSLKVCVIFSFSLSRISNLKPLSFLIHFFSFSHIQKLQLEKNPLISFQILRLNLLFASIVNLFEELIPLGFPIDLFTVISFFLLLFFFSSLSSLLVLFSLLFSFLIFNNFKNLAILFFWDQQKPLGVGISMAM